MQLKWKACALNRKSLCAEAERTGREVAEKADEEI